jgi:hypothetical protein
MKPGRLGDRWATEHHETIHVPGRPWRRASARTPRDGAWERSRGRVEIGSRSIVTPRQRHGDRRISSRGMLTRCRSRSATRSLTGLAASRRREARRRAAEIRAKMAPCPPSPGSLSHRSAWRSPRAARRDTRMWSSAPSRCPTTLAGEPGGISGPRLRRRQATMDEGLVQ